MDWTYEAARLHDTVRKKNVSALQAAVGNFGSIASHALRHPVESLTSAASFVLPHGFLAINDESTKKELERIARRAFLLQQLSRATCWPEYNAACLALDQIEGAEAWKSDDDSDFYDVTAVRHRIARFHSARNADDVRTMINLIRSELTRDLGGICNPDLHKQTRTGAKFLIDDYLATVHDALDRVARACAGSDPRLDKVEVLTELEQTRRSYGRTALLLSGGGTYGMSHIGVIKSLHEANALPRIISGSSSGSIVASVLGSTPDSELLSRLHDFCNGDLAVFIGPHEPQGWSARAGHFTKTGHLFDLGNLRRVMVDLLGKTTFLEAYNRTRRILNIAVTTSTNWESQQILNYATAGNVVIWSAVVASCAVPLGFEPERLLYKSEADPRSLMPWDPMTQYIDGSVNGDLPSSIISAEFDVNHSIVSQVNPHVAPLLKLAQHENTVAQWIVASADLLKLEAINIISYARNLPFVNQDLDVLVKLQSVFTQRYHGDITLLPIDFLARFWTILTNPTPESMEHAVRQGEQATWSMLSMIKTHMSVEMMIDDAVRKVSEYVAFSKSTTDLRKLHADQKRKEGRSSGGRLRSHRHATPEREVNGGDRLRYNANGTSHKSGEGTPPPVIFGNSSPYHSSEDEDDLIMLPRRKRARMDDELTSALMGLAIQTQPNTPSSERRAYFDSSRANSAVTTPGSPSAPPISLMMTPVTPRSASPETNYKSSGATAVFKPRARSKSPSPSPERHRAAKRRPAFKAAARDVAVAGSKRGAI